MDNWELDIEHSEMFPYAIRLAKELGSRKIYIEARIKGETSHNPDILGIRSYKYKKRYVIIECLKSHGQIFDKGGPLEKMSKNKMLCKNAEFHFILRGKAIYRKKRLLELFGNEVNIHKFDDLRKRYGEISL